MFFSAQKDDLFILRYGTDGIVDRKSIVFMLLFWQYFIQVEGYHFYNAIHMGL